MLAATITGARQDLLEALKTFEGKREAAKICQKAAKVESEQSKILNAKAAMIKYTHTAAHQTLPQT